MKGNGKEERFMEKKSSDEEILEIIPHSGSY